MKQNPRDRVSGGAGAPRGQLCALLPGEYQLRLGSSASPYEQEHLLLEFAEEPAGVSREGLEEAYGRLAEQQGGAELEYANFEAACPFKVGYVYRPHLPSDAAERLMPWAPFDPLSVSLGANFPHHHRDGRSYDIILRRGGALSVEVPSPCSGTVLPGPLAGGDCGNWVWLQCDGQAFHWQICHLASRRVAGGQRVRAGQALGVQGNTGARDVHVHVQFAGTGSRGYCHHCGVIDDYLYLLESGGRRRSSDVLAAALGARSTCQRAGCQ